MTIDHAHRRVAARAEGPVTLDDIRHHLDEENRANGLSYSELIDARGAVAALSPAEVRTVVDLLRTVGKGVRLGPTPSSSRLTSTPCPGIAHLAASNGVNHGRSSPAF